MVVKYIGSPIKHKMPELSSMELHRFEKGHFWILNVCPGIDVNFDHIDRDPPQLWVTVKRGIGLNRGCEKVKVGDELKLILGGNLRITGIVKSKIPGHTIILPFSTTWELEDLADNIKLSTKILYRKLRDYSEVPAGGKIINIGIEHPCIPHKDSIMSTKPAFFVIELPNATEAVEAQTGEAETLTEA